MKKINFAIIFLFISLLSYAQDNYPKLYDKKQRTYIITEYQLKTTIKMGIKIDMCEEKLELCKNSNRVKEEKINLLYQSFGMCEDKIMKMDLVIKEKNKQLDIKDKIISEYKKELRQQKVKRIVGGTIGFGLGAIGGVVATTYLLKR
jgi:hypothetical protein